MIQHKAGLTVIELVVILSIITIIAAVTVPSVFQSRERSINSGAQSYVRQVVISVENYLSERITNKVDDLTFGAQMGPCALGVKDEFVDPNGPVNLANYGSPFPFPGVVNSDTDIDPAVVPEQGPAGCAIYKDSKGGYGVVAQAITKDIHTIYNGRLCVFKANRAFLDSVPARPEEWAEARSCKF